MKGGGFSYHRGTEGTEGFWERGGERRGSFECESGMVSGFFALDDTSTAFSLFIRLYCSGMGLEVGGYERKTEWPKMGPSLLIATCLVLAIRTARWSSQPTSSSWEIELEKEIEFAAHVSGRVLALLVKKWPTVFPSEKQAWWKADGEDQAK